MAPASGLILSRDVEVDHIVSAGRTLLVLAPDDVVEVRLQPDERELARLRVGQTAWAMTPAVPGVREQLTVDRILPAVDAERGTIDVRLRLTPGSGLLHPNLTIDVEVELGLLPERVIVPAGAFVEDADGVWALRVEGRRARAVALDPVWRGDVGIAVEGGLRDGDVIVGDVAGLRAGQRVRVAAVPAAAGRGEETSP